MRFFRTAPPKNAAAQSLIADRDCSIQELFAFRNILFGRGRVNHEAGEDPKLHVTVPGQGRLTVDLQQDPFNASTPRQRCFHFHCPVPGISARDLESISMEFEFPHGVLACTRPTASGHAQDKFLGSEKEFWGMTRAKPDARVLEIGSRARSGINRRGLFPASCEYVGFDIVAGDNVDVVGDAHALSRHFPADHFDFAFSVSVWEHLAMPWLVSLELNKVLKPGGVAMINTHQSWPVHEMPWDYFRFADPAWDALFNEATGFEIIDRGMGQPCVMAPSLTSAALHELQIEWHYGYLATRVVVRKTGATTLTWPVDPALMATGGYPH